MTRRKIDSFRSLARAVRDDYRNETEKLLNAAMDHIAGSLEQPFDPRAWEHLLIYCPRDALERRLQTLDAPTESNGVRE